MAKPPVYPDAIKVPEIPSWLPGNPRQRIPASVGSMREYLEKQLRHADRILWPDGIPAEDQRARICLWKLKIARLVGALKKIVVDLDAVGGPADFTHRGWGRWRSWDRIERETAGRSAPGEWLDDDHDHCGPPGGPVMQRVLDLEHRLATDPRASDWAKPVTERESEALQVALQLGSQHAGPTSADSPTSAFRFGGASAVVFLVFCLSATPEISAAILARPGNDAILRQLIPARVAP